MPKITVAADRFQDFKRRAERVAGPWESTQIDGVTWSVRRNIKGMEIAKVCHEPEGGEARKITILGLDSEIIAGVADRTKRYVDDELAKNGVELFDE